MKALLSLKEIIALTAVVVVVVVFWLWPKGPEYSVHSPTSPPKESLPDTPDFTQFAAGDERKDAFFGYFSKLIETRNKTILATREQLLQWHEDRADLAPKAQKQVVQLAKHYRIDDFDLNNEEHWQQLLRRVDIVPLSLALAQAANESAWGTSRFAHEANNYYGQWCFSKGCGVVPEQREEGKHHEVAKFDSPYGSVSAYILNINSHPAYKKLRVMRAQERAANQPIQGLMLANALDKYSERGQEYIDELKSMISYNELDAYDQP